MDKAVRGVEEIGIGGLNRWANIATMRLSFRTLRAEEVETTSSRLSSLRRQHSDLQGQEIDAEDLTTAIAHFDPIWDVLLPRERVRIVRLLIQQVDFDGETGIMGITFQPSGIKSLVAEATTPKDEAA